MMISAKLSDFDYTLPKELIAQTALLKRSEARLLVLDRGKKSIEHRTFTRIIEYLNPGDVLILNDTKVLPARLFGTKKTGGRVEVLLLRSVIPAEAGIQRSLDPRVRGDDNSQIWEALIRPSGRVREGETLEFEGVSAYVLDSPDHETGVRHLRFETVENIEKIIEQIGHVPLPPYIDREDLPVDRELYQTVFARVPGAVASPTAGLHFDEELLRLLETKGIEILFVTLHVGFGTFRSVICEDLADHKMYEEYFEISDETAERINFAKADGRRIVACGTTVVRALESAATDSLPAEVKAGSQKTQMFIYPPYEFKIADALITNFHLPRTTLLMLASAFAGHEFLTRAYQEAIQKKYRFYSYGDAMFIL
jgi:S-adenosylmethionine:tRNA ribosyltransferase-isomerase